MRWYLNDASLQGQFSDLTVFEKILHDLVRVRASFPRIRQNLRATRSLSDARVSPRASVRQALFAMRNKDLRSATLNWFDRAGPFVDDDRLPEPDDYFEFRDIDVTSTGLGEAARRTKAGDDCSAFSFTGGPVDFAATPLEVSHGLPEERYGKYSVPNIWECEALVGQSTAAGPVISSWPMLVEAARERFAHLEIGELHLNPDLAREPFEACLRDRALELMKILNDYVANRDEGGVEGPHARHLVEAYFTGDRALFSGESQSNRESYASRMTFTDRSGEPYLAHWHGKISHRYFRLHFEWPVEGWQTKLQIF